MLFNSLAFLLFFPVVTLIYFALKHNYRWMWLLLASCVFYMFFIPVYISILIITILIDYWAGIKIEDSEGRSKKGYLVVSIVSTCLVLCVFKYFNFFNDNFRELFKLLGLSYPVNALKIILPIGLSFHTFQSLSYVIEVYRGKFKAERHFGIYSLYVMFYPQLVAGPIERPQNILHQFYEHHKVDYKNVTRGLKLMAWGFFKKLVIADRLSPLVNKVYDNPHTHFGWSIILATILFAEQIYCDFSGYSDIAIGSAQVMGFTLMRNFNLPYFSMSISEFWTRWHMSLSTWFRDYVYIPLGGNRVKKWRINYNLLITFLLSGLWHGANWTFIIWGTLNGLYLVLDNLTKKLWQKGYTFIQLSHTSSIYKLYKTLTTCFLICFAWVFFRANTLNEALVLIGNSLKVDSSQINKYILGKNYYSLYTGLVFIIILELIQFRLRRENLIILLERKPFYVRWLVYVIGLTIIINFGVFTNQGFIYFQF